MAEKLIVIGGTAAGLSAASRARKEKPDMEIQVFEKSGFVSYADGLRLCGLHFHAAAVWGCGRAHQRDAVSRVSGGICGIDDWDDREDGEGSGWKS